MRQKFNAEDYVDSHCLYGLAALVGGMLRRFIFLLVLMTFSTIAYGTCEDRVLVHFTAESELRRLLEDYQRPPSDAELAAFRATAEVYAWLKPAELIKLFQLRKKRPLIRAVEAYHREYARALLMQLGRSEDLLEELVRVHYWLQPAGDDLSESFSWHARLTLEQARGYIDLYENSPARPGELSFGLSREWQKALESITTSAGPYQYASNFAIIRGEPAAYQLGFREHCCNGGCTTCAWGFPELTSARGRRERGRSPES